MATNKKPDGERADGYLLRLPDGHQQLFDQNLPRVVKALNATFREQVSLDELILLVLAVMSGDIGRGLAEHLLFYEEICTELTDATLKNREPTVVKVLTGEGAMEFIETLLPEAIPYVRQRDPGEMVCLIFDGNDMPAIMTIRPLGRGTQRFIA